MKKIVAVFGPGSCREGERLFTQAEALGRLLAESKFVVLTGGYDGVMEAASKGAVAASGSTIGVTADVYATRGRESNRYLTKEIRVHSATDRTMELLDLADAYVAIGNSTGTLAEIALAWDYMAKRFFAKKPLVLVGESWRTFLDYVSSESTFAEQLGLLHLVDSEAEAASYLTSFFGPSAQLPSLDILSNHG